MQGKDPPLAPNLKHVVTRISLENVLSTRRFFFHCLIALSLSSAAPAHADEHPSYENLDSPYCAALGQLHSGFNDDFKSLKDTLYDAGQDLKVWSSKVVLPGAKRCDIWQTDAGITLSCEIASAASGEEGEKIFREHRENIERCLGKDWVRGETALAAPDEGFRFLANNPVTGAKVQLEAKKTGEDAKHSVELALLHEAPPPTAETPPEK